MIRFTLFDLHNIVSTAPLRPLLMLGLVAVIGATAPVQGAAIMVGGYMGAMLLSSVFLTDERGRLDALYGLSRVSRTAVVFGRYATALVVGAGTSAFGFVVALVIVAIHRSRVEWTLMGLMALGAFVVAVISISALLPWYFAMGYARGRQAMLVLIIALVGLGWLGSRTSIFDGATIAALMDDGAGITAIILVAGLAVLTASAALASRLYRNRNL
ncbi:ABC-2 transporter permease [Microbacterium protaetiae]|uniref:ABC-2 transporter permease n=1 Tax=Microbacterium protaetiae TaxID=2509458 RepID=A0A4P6EFN4_9MICO|nr:ABC-2 transporter permease [Microbacterium protaetiae]